METKKRPFALTLTLASVLIFCGLTTATGTTAMTSPFTPCPSSPNCLSTMEGGLEPVIFKGTKEEAMAKVILAIQEIKNHRIVTTKSDYIKVEVTSSLFGFVDDLEVYLDEKTKLIHCKSASRVGYSDFGVNKKRVVKLFAHIRSQDD